jgi:arylsulfatase
VKKGYGQRQDLKSMPTATTSCRSSRARQKGPREEIFYFGQGGELNAVRWNDWKVHFAV